MELPKTKPRKLITIPKGAFLAVSNIIEKEYPVEVESTESGYFENGREFNELRIVGEKDILDSIDFMRLYQLIKTAIKSDFDWDFVSFGIRFP